MKLFLRIIILFLLALSVAGLSLFDDGTVVIYVSKYQIQLSLNLLITLFISFSAIIYYGVRMYANIKNLPARIKKARANSALLISQKNLSSAGLHFFEGKYLSCYTSALKAAKKSVNPDSQFIAYLLALKSANVMQDQEKELSIANEIQRFDESKWVLAKNMLIAETLYNNQQFSLCIDQLQNILKIDYRHVPAHFMLMKVFLNLKNYSKAHEMLEWLEKNDSINEKKANKYKLRIVSGLFKVIHDIDSLNTVYKQLTIAEKQSYQYGKLYFDGLIRLCAYDVAFSFLQSNIKTNGLQLMYCEAILVLSKKITNPELIRKLLLIAEKSLTEHKNDANLLTALGVLNYALQILDKAQFYFESSIAIRANTDSYLYLALLSKSTNNNNLLDKCYEQILNSLHSV